MATLLVNRSALVERGSQVGDDDIALLNEVLAERLSSQHSIPNDRLDKVDWSWNKKRESLSESKKASDITDRSSGFDPPEMTEENESHTMHLTRPTLSMMQSDSISSLDCEPIHPSDPLNFDIEEEMIQEVENEDICDVKLSEEPVPKFLIRKGWIEKCGHTFKTWKWRYFELTRDGCLRYYTNEDKNVSKGTIYLEKTTRNDIVIQTHVSTREYFFILSQPHRNYLLSTSTERSMMRWIRALESIGAHAGTGRWDPLRNTVHLTVDENKQAHKWKGYDDPHDAKSTMSGFLLKRGHVRTNWVQRFFKIEILNNHPVLRYFSDEQSTAKGSISLVNAYLSPGTPFSPDGRRNYFMLYCSTHELHLNALSETDMRRWIHALKKAIVVRPHPSTPFQIVVAQATHIAMQLPQIHIEFQSKQEFESILLEGRSDALIVTKGSNLFPTIPRGAQLIRKDGISIGNTIDAARLRLAQTKYPMICDFICPPTKRGEMIKRSRSPHTLTSWKHREILIEHGWLTYLAWHEVRDSFSLCGCYLQLIDLPGHPYCISIGRSPSISDKLVLQASSEDERMSWAATVHCSILMASHGLDVNGMEMKNPFFI